MSDSTNEPLDAPIDKLTNSIENSFTGEVFSTVVTKLGKENSEDIVPAEWVFDWMAEFENEEKLIFKLTTENNPQIIHGLICL